MQPPFLTLNQYLRALFGQRVQKIPLDAGLSCPNRDGTKGVGGCIYCDALGSGTGLSRRGKGIREQMMDGIRWAKRRYKAQRFIAYFQAFSNTYAPPERLQALYKEALVSEDVVGLFIGTRPDCIDEAVLDAILYASRGRLVTVELGLQSANDKTLRRINRGHTVQDFINAVELLKKRDIPVCAHVIFGLPGEGPEQMIATIHFLRELGINGIKFHQLYILRGTKLHEEYKNGGIQLLKEEEYSELVAKSILELPSSTVIHRLQGDPPRDRLIAPLWSLSKDKVRKEIIKKLTS